MSEPVSAVVVAGGKSVRLGEDKRRLRLWGADGPTLLERTVEIMAGYTEDVVVVLNDPQDWPTLRAKLVADAFPDGGVLGGIWSGLSAIAHDHAFVVAGDMPLLDEALIRWMIEQPRTYDVLVPRVGGGRARNKLGVESTHAIYSRRCRHAIQRQLEAGNPQIIGFFPHVVVQYVEPEVVARFDPDGVAFRNINTPEELADVRRIIERRATV
jgi:molybdenum cofactor guanylyltransferase